MAFFGQKIADVRKDTEGAQPPSFTPSPSSNFTGFTSLTVDWRINETIWLRPWPTWLMKLTFRHVLRLINISMANGCVSPTLKRAYIIPIIKNYLVEIILLILLILILILIWFWYKLILILILRWFYHHVTSRLFGIKSHKDIPHSAIKCLTRWRPQGCQACIQNEGEEISKDETSIWSKRLDQTASWLS